MSTLSYLNYDNIGAFEGLYQQYQQTTDFVDQEWYDFLSGLNFQRQIFFNGTKEAGCPTLVRLLLKHQGIYVGYIREMLYSHVTDKTIDVSQ